MKTSSLVLTVLLVALLAVAAALVVGVGPMAQLFTPSAPAPVPAPAPEPNAARAAAPAPTGAVILTITGAADAAGQPIDAGFDLASLQALPVVEFETTTMWTEGVQKFQGVALKTLLDQVNVTSGLLIATAINDYRIEIPIAEISDSAPIIAYALNGAPMSVRDKGPLWVVYPYDSNPDFQTEVVFSRSIWQLNRLEIAP